MEKKHVRAQIVNGDWEIKKYKIKKRCKEVGAVIKQNIKPCVYCFAIGAGAAVVYMIKDEYGF